MNLARTVKYRGYTPRAHQKAVNDAVIGKKGVVVTVKSRRQSGKSFMSLNLLLFYAINVARSKNALVSITLAQSRKVFKELVDAVENSKIIKKKNEQTLEIQLINGSMIFFKSSEQGTEALRGYTITGILVLDEASFLSEDILEAVLPWTNVHKPPILIVSTPKFKNCFFYRYFMKGYEGNPKYISIDWNDYDLSEFLDDETLHEYQRMLPKNQFKTEYLGEFLDDDGVVFENFKNCIKAPTTTKGKRYVGIDWGTGQGQDYTSITMLNELCEETEWYSFNNLNTTQTIERITEILKGVDVELVLCESNSIGTPMTELLTQANPRMRIESATTTNTSKAQMVSALQVRLEKGTITLLDEPRQTAEISAYEAVYNPKTKNVTYNAPQGLHDDSVISLMLALKAYEQGNKKGKYIVR